MTILSAFLLAATLVADPALVTSNAPAPASVSAGAVAGAPAGTNAAGAGGAPGFVLPGAAAVGVTEDPAEVDYRRLLEVDDAAHEEIDLWIREADAAGAAADTDTLRKRIETRMTAIETSYREFLEKHPGHVKARVAYGSFLNDTGRELEARGEWEKALAADPKNAAIYNNLAGIYGHRGPITNAFVYYEKAIELEPRESVYHQNLATTVALFRKDVMEHYGFKDEQKVFDLALRHYRKALELDPESFLVATDLAQTFYLIKPPRHEEALKAWAKALELASDDLEREGIRVHLARVQVQAGKFAEARTNLSLVTHENYSVLKERIQKTLEKRERNGAAGVPEKLDGLDVQPFDRPRSGPAAGAKPGA